jgi:hypothetical protein
MAVMTVVSEREDEEALTTVAPSEVATPPSARSSGFPIRWACHLSAAALFVVALVADLAHGWLPTGDDAIIAQRAWTVLSAHPPLVGQFSQASGSIHPIYDPGPIIFWLLAAPVRVDPVHGVLWGSVLLCLFGAALAVEAAWAFRGAPAAIAVVVVLAVVAATQAFVVVNPAWNISVGVVWFIAAIVVTLTVASGRLRWWPLLVGAGSIAAQSHLEFAPVGIGLVVLGLGLGLARRPWPRRWGWLAAGLGVGALCWAAPVVDEFTRRPGNLTVLWDWLDHGSTFGAKLGFQALGAAAGPHPLWTTQQGRGNGGADFLVLLAHINGRSERSGMLILASVALVALVAWILRRRDLATTATVALFASAMAVWAFSSLPQASVLTLIYSDIILWPVGMLVWVVWLWAAGALVLAAVRTLRPRVRWRRSGPEDGVRSGSGVEGEEAKPIGASPPRHRRSGRRRYGSAGRWATAVGVLLVGAVGAGVARSTVPDPHLGVLGGWSSVDLVPAGAAAVDRVRPTGPVALYAEGPDADVDYSVAYGVIWMLRHQGRDVTAISPHWKPLGPDAAPTPQATRLLIHIHPDRTVSVTVTVS